MIKDHHPLSQVLKQEKNSEDLQRSLSSDEIYKEKEKNDVEVKMSDIENEDIGDPNGEKLKQILTNLIGYIQFERMNGTFLIMHVKPYVVEKKVIPLNIYLEALEFHVDPESKKQSRQLSIADKSIEGKKLF